MITFAVSSYSFIQLIRSGKMSQLDCVAKAKEMGFDAIEIADLVPPDGVSEDEHVQLLADESKKLNFPISNFTISAEFLNCPDFDAEVARVKGKVDQAQILGAKGLRHDAAWGFAAGKRQYRGFDDALPVLADGCRQVTEYAATKGIRTMVENHGYFAQDSDRVEKLVNTVAHENFGLLCDMGNFICADESPSAAVGRIAPYAFYVHAKDFHVKDASGPNPGKGFFRSRSGMYLRGAILGHGDVPVVQCLSALNIAGYDGFISIEFEGVEDPLFAIEVGLENLKKYVAQVF